MRGRRPTSARFVRFARNVPVSCGLGRRVTLRPNRVAPYATYGSQELAANMLDALRDRTGCLLRNHGTIVHAASLDQAYDHTAQLEWMCQVWLAATAAGAPSLLPRDEID